MDISLVDDTRSRLLEFKRQFPSQYPYREIAARAGLSYWWLIKFAQGRAQNPTANNLEALRTALTNLEVQNEQAATAES